MFNSFQHNNVVLTQTAPHQKISLGGEGADACVCGYLITPILHPSMTEEEMGTKGGLQCNEKIYPASYW